MGRKENQIIFWAVKTVLQNTPKKATAFAERNVPKEFKKEVLRRVYRVRGWTS